MQKPSLLEFHTTTKNKYAQLTPLSHNFWPIEWKTTYYKEYPRFDSLLLPKPEMHSKLADLTAKRKSERTFSTNGLTIEELSNLLQHMGGEFTHADGSIHRAQASGGARFSIEMYPIVNSSASPEMQPGVYHYNVKAHTLEYLWPITANGTKPEQLVRGKWATEASVHIMFTAVFWRSSIKYGNRSYRHVCMEAGAMLQNAYLYAAATDLKLVGYAGTNDNVVENLLRLDVNQESLISSCLVGT
jgi:SagB-type dehydrogenase family enzyme